MEDWLLYSLQSAGVLAVFYLFYKVLLSRETFHRFNRAVLLLSVALAAVLPLCRITFYREVEMVLPDVSDTPLQLPVTAAQEGAFDVEARIGAVGWIYLCGVAGYLLYGLVSAGAIVRLLREGRTFRFGRHGVRLVLHKRKEAPFSWIRWIVLSEHDFGTAARPIVTHESAHLRSGHSWDLIAADLLGAVQWFNPAMWLVRAELRALHEYEADAAVLRSGADAREYQLLLIKKAVGARWCSVANSFNHSKLKNRITMMLRKKSSARTALRALYLVPLTGFALGAFARTVIVPVCPADKVSEISALVQASGLEKTAAEAAAFPELCVGTGVAALEVVAADSAVSVPTEKKPMKRVSGMVRADGTPLVGALVRVSGQKRGTVTDTEGCFSMAVAPGEVLEVSYVGRKKELVKVDDPERSIYVDLAAEDSHPAVADSAVSVPTEKKPMKRVSGMVRADGTPLVGALVCVSGQKRGTVTDAEGRFSMAVVPGEVLEVSYVGRKKELVKVEDPERPIYVDLAAEDSHPAVADTVIMVSKARDGAYVITTKSSRTADPAAPKIDSTTIRVVKFPPVGDPKSFVYILDGREVDTVEDLDPGRIKSMSILKNPEEVAKYGERARDGVVVITTKSSKTADPAAPKIDPTTIRVVKFPPVGDPKSIVYVLDGKVVDTVEDIDPDRIKSMSILKNPEAVAKYGDRARDGVVVITTKSSGTDGGTGVVTSESSKSE